MTTERETNLDEWCSKLPKNHLVNKELRKLRRFVENNPGKAVYSVDTEDGNKIEIYVSISEHEDKEWLYNMFVVPAMNAINNHIDKKYNPNHPEYVSEKGGKETEK